MPQITKDNAYEILGIRPDAHREVMHAAYRALARKYHPDVNKDPDAEDAFKMINEAYHQAMSSYSNIQIDPAGDGFDPGIASNGRPAWFILFGRFLKSSFESRMRMGNQKGKNFFFKESSRTGEEGVDDFYQSMASFLADILHSSKVAESCKESSKSE